MGYTLGASVADTTRKTYVNLRTGRIAQTSKEPLDGFEPAFTTKKDGTKTHFFAKEYKEIIGYITALNWHVSTFPDGSTDGGAWNVDIDTGSEIFCLSVKKTDRPFLRFCSVLCGINFDEPVRFAGYKFLEGGHDKKVLCLYQFGTEGAMQPIFQEKWLSQTLKDKIRGKEELNENDQKNLAFSDDGTILKPMVFDEMEGTFSEGYPYIVQSSDLKWDLGIWTKFLDAKVKEIVLPMIAEANAKRNPIEMNGEPYVDEPEMSGVPEWQKPVDDDDIPF